MKLDETKLQEVVEKIAYQQFRQEQIDDLYAKMGILNEYVQEQLRLFAVIKSLPDSDEIRMKARELDEKDFDQWWWETVYKGNVYNNVRIQV